MRKQSFILAYKYLIPFVILFLVYAGNGTAQNQSGRVYEFLNLPTTAHITALGGYASPVEVDDLGMALFYPALLSETSKGELSLNFIDYFADISHGTAAGSFHIPDVGNFSASVQYVNYGSFTHANELGIILGEFTGAEYAISFGWGRKLTDRISMGANLKLINSSFDQYNSFGVATDISLAYLRPENNFHATLVFRNIGRQISTYASENEPLPFDIVLGVSKKLENAPLRFSIVAHNLHKPDLTYPVNPDFDNSFQSLGTEDEEQDPLADLGDQVMRHMVFGMEFLPSRNFMVAIGYNYRRRQEMKVDTRLSTVGLSWGVGIRISHFMLRYARANYHLAGAPNHFSVSTNLDRLFFTPAPDEQPSIRQER